MRCKSCLRTFSQPSKITKETQICSVCRGTKTCLKNRELCERSPQFLINSGSKFGKIILDNFEKHDDRCFIEHLSRKKIPMEAIIHE